jgi:hypothetical protein
VTTETNLSQRMRALAKTRSDLPADWLEKADAFDKATAGFYADPQTVDVKQFVGCFARARRMWCEATGEPLV